MICSLYLKNMWIFFYRIAIGVVITLVHHWLSISSNHYFIITSSLFYHYFISTSLLYHQFIINFIIGSSLLHNYFIITMSTFDACFIILQHPMELIKNNRYIWLTLSRSFIFSQHSRLRIISIALVPKEVQQFKFNTFFIDI